MKTKKEKKEMELINNVYSPLKIWKEKQGVYSFDKLQKTEEWANYLDYMEELKKFDGKRVKIRYRWNQDFFCGDVETKGRIKVVDDMVRFYQGKRTRRYYNLDGGVFEGWFATVIPLKIETI